ncbi:MAG: YdeI/OmpD-associated family protein [Flavobacteriaceae bacterium]|nr:YdeI/OmpD-associated family protein [Bacteroidia bacterium]NND11070.1 YdeI/OmpD-associated family protein [Flavobacteriaceae bacterium]NNK28805.1 YdeI/OmpD-associated family protein [Flavobacteriaceae bacterium]NNL61710.1 YdeI/OmpD-associated family protein [Flavobacteriaceae bacterium]
MKSEIFEVTIDQGHSIIIPAGHAEPFLESKDNRVKVEASFKDKKIIIHSKIQKDRSGNYRITFGKQNQKALGIFPSDYFNLQFFEDTSKYGVDMPDELQAVLDTDSEAFEIFESFTPGKQRSIIYMISRYKNSQTKIDKSLILTDNIKRGIRDNKELLK